MSNHNDVTLKNMTYNGQKVKKWFHNDAHIFSAGNIVTYHVDREVSYWEEVDSGASCLSPNTFTPTKDGWTFLGWREDTTASADVLSSKVMGDEPISLYAVYKQDITLKYEGNGQTSGSVANETKTRYYNAYGNTLDPTFTLKANGFSRTDYNFTGWNIGAVGATVTLSANTTAYAQWSIIQRSWLMSGWTTQWTAGSGVANVSSNSSTVYAQITEAYGFDVASTLIYISPEIDITNYKTLSYAGNYDWISGSTDHYTMKLYLLNSSGSVVATIYTSAKKSDASFSSTFDLSGYSGKHKIAVSLGAYRYNEDSGENQGTNATLTKATLT